MTALEKYSQTKGKPIKKPLEDNFPHKDLISIETLKKKEIQFLLNRAQHFSNFADLTTNFSPFYQFLKYQNDSLVEVSKLMQILTKSWLEGINQTTQILTQSFRELFEELEKTNKALAKSVNEVSKTTSLISKNFSKNFEVELSKKIKKNLLKEAFKETEQINEKINVLISGKKLDESFVESNYEKVELATQKKPVVSSIFIEPSTRTKSSFEMAARNLSIDFMDFYKEGSSLAKGESLKDTVRNISFLAPDALILRQENEDFLLEISKEIDQPIINAGDGQREHPTQALLDALTILQKKGSIEGLKIAIIGDIKHSRVAKSNFHLLTKMGAKVFTFGHDTLMPNSLPKGVKFSNSIKSAFEEADVIMMLRIQKERMEKEFPVKNYLKEFGLDKSKLAWAKKDVIVMHPGPINRNIEISDEVVDDEKHSVIDLQVQNGVAVRMAVLETLIKNYRKRKISKKCLT